MTGSSERLPGDQAARDRVRTDVSSTLFVEAGAGTGKTRALVDRVVELVRSGSLDDVGGLAAITFTEAAAAELRDRIRSALQRAEVAGDPLAGERCRRAVERLDDAAITTLHGFAQRLLAEFPLEAGLPPGFEVADPIEAELDFAERWSEFVDDLFADPSLEAVLLRAFTLGCTVDALEAVAAELHGHWDRLVAPVELRSTVMRIDLGPVVAQLDRLIDLALCCPDGDALADRMLAETDPVRLRLHRSLERTDSDGREALLLVLNDLADLKAGNQGRKDDAGRALKEQVRITNETRAVVLDELRRDALEPLVARLTQFTLDGARHRRHIGRLEFHDLLVLAARLLRASPTARTELGRRYQAVLIDEFQDTDPLQVEIVVLLGLADPTLAPEHWSDAVLAPGRLCFVGDPKQSIYRFRRADVATYEQAKLRFAAEPVLLTENFRSSPAVIDWVNAVFERLIVAASGEQPAFVELVAHREQRAGTGVATLGGPHDDRRVGEIREIEAGEVAATIRALHDRGLQVPVNHDDAVGAGTRALRYEDVAVLIPARTGLRLLEQAFADQHVPYRVSSRSLVFGSDEVREVLAILRALDNPADEVAIVAALRSAGTACSDVDLVEYRRAGGRWRYLGPDEVELAPDHPVLVGLATLRALREHVAREPVNLLVDRVLRTFRLVELTTAVDRPRDHWRRYRLLLDEARAFVQAGGQSLADFVAWIDRQADEQASRLETIVPEADDDAVQILTVHGAKGLEYPVVVLAGLNALPPRGRPPVLWDGTEPVVRIGTGDRAFESDGYPAVLERERRHDDLERLRLLYVAATRARELLVVSLHHKGADGAKCLAGALWESIDGAVGGLDEVLAAAPPAVPAPPGPPPTPPVPTTPPVDWRRDRDALLARAARSSPIAPTAVAREAASVALDDRQPTDAGEHRPGRRGHAGTAVGRAVHGVLQLVDLGSPHATLDALAEAQSWVEGVPDRAAGVAALARSALESPPVREAVTSSRFWREVPVAAPVGDRVVEGYVDLLYERADGSLVVVDYKTDQARSESELDDSVERYRLQGAAYALALEVALDRPVTEVAFVFCRPGGAVVKVVDDLPGAVAEARAIVAG